MPLPGCAPANRSKLPTLWMSITRSLLQHAQTVQCVLDQEVRQQQERPSQLALVQVATPHQHLSYNTPLPSMDVFFMSLKHMKPGDNWAFGMDAVIFDTNGFDEATLNDATTDQFNDAAAWPPEKLAAGNSRRLLSSLPPLTLAQGVQQKSALPAARHSPS